LMLSALRTGDVSIFIEAEPPALLVPSILLIGLDSGEG